MGNIDGISLIKSLLIPINSLNIEKGSFDDFIVLKKINKNKYILPTLTFDFKTRPYQRIDPLISTPRKNHRETFDFLTFYHWETCPSHPFLDLFDPSLFAIRLALLVRINNNFIYFNVFIIE